MHRKHKKQINVHNIIGTQFAKLSFFNIIYKEKKDGEPMAKRDLKSGT